MKVFVAGATGIIGMAAVRQLVGAGHAVTGVARNAAKAEALAALGGTPVEVDIFDRAGITTAMSGHDVVCNLTTHIPTGRKAARAKSWHDNDRIRAEGSRVLVQAAIDAGVQRFVQEAVAFAYADNGEEWIDESGRIAPAQPVRSSVTATETALEFATDGRFAVALRFGALYGDDPLTRWQLDRVRRGKPVILGSPDAYLSPLHVDDAATAVLASLGSPSGAYNVAAEPVRRSEWARVMGRAAGMSEPARFVSPFAQRFSGWRVQAVGRSLRVSSSAFHTMTGWRARMPLSAGWPSFARR